MVQSTKKRLFTKSLALAVIAALAMTTGAAQAYNDGAGSRAGDLATAVGDSAIADGKRSVAVGRMARTEKGTDATTSIGYNAQATANNSTAIGAFSVADRFLSLRLKLVNISVFSVPVVRKR